MTQLTANDLTILLLAISVILLVSRFASELGRKIGLPIVMGELLVGILLGPTVLGSISPQTYNTIFPFQTNPHVAMALDGIFSLAVIMLLFIAGLEVQLAQVISQGRITLCAGAGSMLAPFALGACVAWVFPQLFGISAGDGNRLIFALFLGSAMSISALPVIARILLDLKIFRTKVGMVILSTAILNDLVGWLFFSFILSLQGKSSGDLVHPVGDTMLYLSLFCLAMLVFGKFALGRLLRWIQTNLSWPGGVLSFSLGFCLLCAAITESIHIHAILGAFIAGIAIGDSVHLQEKAREIMHQFVTSFFAPLFFVSIGLKVNFIQYFDLSIVSVILVIAFFGKVSGASLGAKAGGLDWNRSLAVGFGLNARGAMEILLGSLALQAGLISQYIFVALVIMALVTSITSAPMMRHFLKKA